MPEPNVRIVVLGVPRFDKQFVIVTNERKEVRKLIREMTSLAEATATGTRVTRPTGNIQGVRGRVQGVRGRV